MAGSGLADENSISIADAVSDYGSDFDEAAVADLFARTESQQPLKEAVVQSIEDANTTQQRTVHLQRFRQPILKTFICEDGIVFEAEVHEGPIREPSVEVEYDESNRTAFSPAGKGADAERELQRAVSIEPENGVVDTRSPLERFRKPPKKPMSVTDIVSPAWCELQYWYSLTKYGRVRRTRAMKQGSSVHKVLEEQVHKEVPVEVVSREDAFGLRLWNVIQGLRTLRATGMTRELEVFGVVEGEVMIGIIDEINTRCPDEQAETNLLEDPEASGGSKAKKKSVPLGANQRTLTDYLTGSQNSSVLEDSLGWLGTLREKPRTFYLMDVKTRQSKSLPSAESQLRPTKMQLMMYYRLFSALAANEVPAIEVLTRYTLDPNATFSDLFIAQIASLDFNFPEDATMSDEEAVTQSSQDSVVELLAHNTLSTLWAFMMDEYAKTLLTSSPQPAVISPLLTAEYRASGDGSLLGKRSFAFDSTALDAYVTDEMRWWKGERETKGVDIEEAYKCRICEFAEGCTWRIEKLEEATKKARLRGGARRKSQI